MFELPQLKSANHSRNELSQEYTARSSQSKICFNEIEQISQRSSFENVDTLRFLRSTNFETWKQNQERRANTFLNTSSGFQRVDDFQGQYLEKIYDQNFDVDLGYNEVAKEATKEYLANFEPPLKDYALRRMKMQKLRKNIVEKNKSKAI